MHVITIMTMMVIVSIYSFSIYCYCISYNNVYTIGLVSYVWLNLCDFHTRYYAILIYTFFFTVANVSCS